MWADCIPSNYTIGINFGCSSDNVNKVITKVGELFEELRNSPVEQTIIEKIKQNRKLSKDERVRNIYPSSLFREYPCYGDIILSRKYKKESKRFYEHITPEQLQKFCQKVFSSPENVYVAILTDSTPDKFYSYEEIQKILTSSPKRSSKRNTKMSK